MQNGLTIAGRTYASRLLVGTGKYRGFEETRMAIDASGTEIVTVTIRRVNIGQASNEPNLLDFVPPSKYTILPNTASCYTAKDAVYTLQLARELLGDEKTLFPNMPETLKAAEALVKDGFDVMVYCGDDPIQAKLLEQIGSRCAGAGRCRRRHGLRCGDCDGARLRRRADEYSDRRPAAVATNCSRIIPYLRS